MKRNNPSIYFFAKAKDTYGKDHYLSADSEEAIEKYCEPEGGITSTSKVIDCWINHVDPIMVCFHFKWVGKRRNPFVTSKKHHYDYEGISKVKETLFKK